MSGFGSSASAISAEVQKIGNAPLGVAALDSVGGRLRGMTYEDFIVNFLAPNGLSGYQTLIPATAQDARDLQIILTTGIAASFVDTFALGAAGLEVPFAQNTTLVGTFQQRLRIVFDIPAGSRLSVETSNPGAAAAYRNFSIVLGG